MDDPVAELPAMVDEGVSTAKAFMVFDFRLDDRRLFDAMRVLGGRGGMLQVHCEDPVLIDTAVADALARGDTAPQFHAATRSTEAEEVATHRVMAFARAADVPVHVVHLSSRAALEHVREAKARGVRAYAETCPHYLALTDARYGAADLASVAECVISPPLRPQSDQDALWTGLAGGALDLIATDHVPDRMAIEKAEAVRGTPFNRISNGAPGIETLLTIAYAEGVAKGRLSVERMVDLAGDDAGPAVRPGAEGRDRARSRRGPRALRSRRRGARFAPPTSTTPATTRHTRVSRWRARSARSSCAAGPSSATARSSGSAAPAASSGGPRRESDPTFLATQIAGGARTQSCSYWVG